MKKSEFKNEIYSLFSETVDGMTYEEKISYIEKLVYDYQKDNDNMRSTPNKGNPWTDEELMVILNDAPTVQNCVKYAKIFGRGYGSIEQIYRWASTPLKDITGRRKNDEFVKHVKQIAKALGRRA